MKRNIIISFIAAVSAILLAASCQKQEHPEYKASEGNTFMAFINQEITKTTITSAYKVNWDQGDLIDINGGTTYSAIPDASDPTKAGFTKVSGEDQAPDYTAVYPSSLFNNSRYELPATQTYVKDKFNAPMCAYGSTETLEFKNMCGVLCFALKGTDKIKSIAVSTNKETEEPLCGAFDFTTAPEFGFTGDEGCTVTLNCGEGVQLNSESLTNFYVYLPPSDYAAGMTITITNTAGNVFRKTTVTDITIARSKVYTFNWTPVFAPTSAVQGVFSVSATKKVYFSQGNLYCGTSEGDPETYVFKFEENQYDFYHDDWEEEKEKHVSYFYWTDIASLSPQSPMPEKENLCFLFTNQSGNTPKTMPETFVVNEEEGWRTLSKAEWNFLLHTRPEEGPDQIVELSYTPFIENPAIISGEGYYGLFIYPDNYIGAKAAGEDESLDTWEEINNLGIAFLPLTEISGKEDLENGWMYWTSELYGEIGTPEPPEPPYTASYVFLNNEDGTLFPRIGGEEEIDQMALPIRLVKDYGEEE